MVGRVPGAWPESSDMPLMVRGSAAFRATGDRCPAATAVGRRRVPSRERCRSVVAMQATWSQPVAELVVFSNDLAHRRERPRRP